MSKDIQMVRQHQPKASIDHLATQKSLIDLSQIGGNDFDLFPDEFTLSTVFDDIVLCQYIDESDEGEVMRGGIVLPENLTPKAWRKAVVVLTGPSVSQCEPGNIIVFPNNFGMAVSNLEVEGFGRLKKGMFLQESKIFGVCQHHPKEEE